MRKGLTVVVPLLIALGIIGLMASPCALAKTEVIKIGINAPMTGDIPKVGEGSKFAARMWLGDIEATAAWRSAERNIRSNWSSRTTSPRPNRR